MLSLQLRDADPLSSLGGFDSWWDEQRAGRAAPRLELLGVQPAPTFEYLPTAQLTLTTQTAQSDPVQCGPMQFQTSGPPPPFVEYAAPKPARAEARVAPVQQKPSPQPAARQLLGAAADPHLPAKTKPLLPEDEPAAKAAPSRYVPNPLQPPIASPSVPAAAAKPKSPRRPEWDDRVDQKGGTFEPPPSHHPAALGPPADLTEARLRGVREHLFREYEGRRWQPFFKAQLRRSAAPAPPPTPRPSRPPPPALSTLA